MTKNVNMIDLSLALDIDLDSIRVFYRYFGNHGSLSEFESKHLNSNEIRTISSIHSFLLLGYSPLQIVDELKLEEFKSFRAFTCFSLETVLNDIPNLFIATSFDENTLFTHNTLDPSINSLLDHDQVELRYILTGLNISTEDIDKLVEAEHTVLTSKRKAELTFNGYINGEVVSLKAIILISSNKFNKECLATIIINAKDERIVANQLLRKKIDSYSALDEIPYPILFLEGTKVVYANSVSIKKFSIKSLENYSIDDFISEHSGGLFANEYTAKNIISNVSFDKSNTILIEEFPLWVDGRNHVFKLNVTNMEKEIILVGFTDITETNEHQENLMNERNLFRNGPVMILKCSYEGEKKNIDWISDNVLHFTGYTREEFLANGSDINDFIAEEDKEELYAEAAKYLEMKLEHYTHRPYKIIRKDKSEIWVKDHTSLTFNKNKKYVGFSEYLIDVSDMKEFEDELKDAKEKAESANLAKSTFLSHMSHEIRTPLNAINGFSQLIYDVESDMDKRDKLRTIVKSGEHLLNIINNILELSKVEAGSGKLSIAEYSLKSMLEHVVKLIQVPANQKSIKVNLVKSTLIPDYVMGDELKLKQILINILSNAVNYTEMGTITIDISHKNDIAVFKIIDSGVGIEKDRIQSVFDAFEQIKHHDKNITSGTGLGLAIVKNLVNALDGKIEVDSEVNVGTTFMVTVPLRKSGRSDMQKIKESKIDYDFSNLKILVAEDNKINQKLIRAILRKVKVKCDLADNGQIALDMMAENSYDILLLDMQMPVLDGMATIKQIRENTALAGFPVIALTAFAMHEESKKFITAGCDGFVAKPINKAELYGKINTLCNNS